LDKSPRTTNKRFGIRWDVQVRLRSIRIQPRATIGRQVGLEVFGLTTTKLHYIYLYMYGIILYYSLLFSALLSPKQNANWACSFIIIKLNRKGRTHKGLYCRLRAFRTLTLILCVAHVECISKVHIISASHALIAERLPLLSLQARIARRPRNTGTSALEAVSKQPPRKQRLFFVRLLSAKAPIVWYNMVSQCHCWLPVVPLAFRSRPFASFLVGRLPSQPCHPPPLLRDVISLCKTRNDPLHSS